MASPPRFLGGPTPAQRIPNPSGVQIGRWQRFMQKLASIKGNPGPMTLMPDIALGIPLFHGVEDRYLEAWDTFGIYLGIASQGVGNSAGARFRNPSASGVVAVFTLISVSAPANDSFNVRIGTPAGDLAAVIPVSTGFDTRGRTSPSVIVSDGIPGAAFGLRILRKNVLANSSVDFLVEALHEIPVLPGSVIQIEDTNTNQAVDIVAWWRERALEDSEKT